MGKWKPIRKVVAAGLSGLTATGVVEVLDLAHLHVSQGLAGLLVGIAGLVAGYLVPSPAAPGH